MLLSLVSFYINDKSVSSRSVREGLKPSRLVINKVCFFGKAYHIDALRLALLLARPIQLNYFTNF